MRLATVGIVLLTMACGSKLAAQPAAVGGCIDGEEPAGHPHVRAVDDTARARLSELLVGSTLVREMLGYLQSANVSMAIRSNRGLLRHHRSGGLSRFFVNEGVLAGSLEFDNRERNESEQRVALAHELGHAVEIATLTRRTTADLGNQLLAHIGRHDPWSAHLVIETPFAREIDKRVVGELKYGAAPPGTLRTLAARHRVKLTECPASRWTP